MAVKFEDYYETLGVSRDASQQDIQRAFRKLARQYHPDVNKEASAEEQFRKINEAYEVLKDPEKRKKYDQLGANWQAGQDFRPPPGYENMRYEFGGQGQGGGFSPEGFSDFFEMFFGSRGGGGRTAGSAGFEDLFRQAGQAGGHGGAAHRAAPEQEAQLDITLDEAYRGSTRSLSLQGPAGTKTLEVKIPAGTTDGSKIRLRGENLLLNIKVAKHPDFTLQGKNLTTEVKLQPWQAALGAKMDVKTMEGTVTLSVPPGTQSGQKMRLRGKGMPVRKGEPGDLFVRMMIAVPKELTDEQRELYEKLKEISTHKQS